MLLAQPQQQLGVVALGAAVRSGAGAAAGVQVGLAAAVAADLLGYLALDLLQQQQVICLTLMLLVAVGHSSR
jgi:hypothetical protein